MSLYPILEGACSRWSCPRVLFTSFSYGLFSPTRALFLKSPYLYCLTSLQPFPIARKLSFLSFVPLRYSIMMFVHDDASLDSTSYDSLLDFNWRDKTSWKKETWRGPLSTRVLLPPRFLVLPSLPSPSYYTSSEESLSSEDSCGFESPPPSPPSSKHRATCDGESHGTSPPPVVSALSTIHSQVFSPVNRGKHPRNTPSSTPPMNQPSDESLMGSPRCSPCSPQQATARRRLF